MRAVRAAGPDHLRGYGFRDVLVLKSEHRLQAAAFGGVFGEGGFFLAEAGDLLLQLLVLLAGVAKVDVVVPDAAGVEAGAVHDALDRCDESDCPAAKQGDFSAVGGATWNRAFDRALHLDGERDNLKQYKDDQDQRVSETEEEGIHGAVRTGGSTLIIPFCRDQRCREIPC